jgi:hypothetical protein
MSHDDESRDIQSLLRRAYDVPLPEPGFVQGLGERLARELSVTRAGSGDLGAPALRPRRRFWLLIPAAAAAMVLAAVAAHLLREPEGAGPPEKDRQIAQRNPKAPAEKAAVEPRTPGVAGDRVAGAPKRVLKESLAAEKPGQLRLMLRERTLEQRVAEAQVIVVATALDSAPAPAKRPGDLPENLIRFQVARVLKGKLADKVITTRTPTAADEFIGKQWVLLLSPEFVAGKHQFVDCNWIKAEAEVKALLSSTDVAVQPPPTNKKPVPERRVLSLRVEPLDDQSVAEAAKVSDAGSKEPAWGKSLNGLRLGLSRTDIKGDGKLRLLAVLQNVSSDDLTVNLGLMLGNGKKQLPTAVRLIFTNADGKKRILERKVGGIAGRVDPFGVPLAAGCRYTISCNLAEYYDEALLGGEALAPGRYQVSAEFAGKAPADTTGLALMYYWSGTIESDKLQVTLPAKTAK